MMNLTNMRIGKRLAVGFGVALLLTVIIAGVGWWAISSLNAAADTALSASAELRRTQTVMLNNSRIQNLILKVATAPDKNHEQQYRAEMGEVRQALKAELAEGEARATSETSKQLTQNLSAGVAAQRETNDQALGLAASGKSLEALQVLHGPADVKRTATVAIANQLEQWQDQNRGKAEEQAAQITTRTRWILGLLTLLVTAISIVLGIMITHSISRPLGEGAAFLERISTGDVTHEVPADMLARADEVGDLGRSMQAMSAKLRHLLRDIATGVQTVASSATQLTAASTQTASGVKSMSEKSATVAAAAEESCATTTAVSISMEKASVNLTSVAGATEEMSSTVAEIASNSEKARVISEKAMAQAQTISAMMAELGRAAQEIGKVTETITDISAQTNLLV